MDIIICETGATAGTVGVVDKSKVEFKSRLIVQTMIFFSKREVTSSAAAQNRLHISTIDHQVTLDKNNHVCQSKTQWLLVLIFLHWHPE
jgi:transcription elongation factor